MKYWKPAVFSTVVAMVAVLATSLNPAQGATTQLVSYHGYKVSVPADWKVVDLATHPTACVRFDQSAVYLGHSDAQPNCPARLAGRTDGLVIEPLASAAAGRDAAAALPGTATVPAGTSSVDGEIQVAVQDAGVLVTAYHAPDQEQAVRDILDSAELTSGGTAARLVSPRSALATTASIVATGSFKGKAFDACTAPPQSTMDAWKSSSTPSPYTAVGIYISGARRACAQPNLTSAWVAANAAKGWQFLLIDVGLQAPCTNFSSKMSADPATARAQGRTAAAGAAAAAANLGFGQRSAIYTDIENYTRGASCTAAVLSYISGWTLELNTRGYVGGVYVNSGSGVLDLNNAYNNTSYTRPDNLWFARWNKLADTNEANITATGAWTNHQRVHQYNNLTETYGGVTVNIDANYGDLTAPPPAATGFSATGLYGGAAFKWTAPAGTSVSQFIVRRNTGGFTPPALPTTGTAVYAGTATSVTATGMANSANYGFRVWVKDSTGKIGPGADTRLIGVGNTVVASASSITYGGSVTLTTLATRKDTGGALAGVPLSLYARAKNSSTWREVAKPTSSSTGYATSVQKPTVSTYYMWGYNGSTGWGVSRSGSVLVDVRPLITAYLSTAAIKLGGHTGFYGYMRPQHPGTTVYLQRLSGSTWGTTAKMALNSTGNYAFTIKPVARGTYTYRVIWLADADHASTWTVAKTFSVS